jgi:LysM repeat protein
MGFSSLLQGGFFMKRLTAAITVLVIAVALFGVVRPAFAQDSGTSYVVQPGDNLYRISLKFGIAADAIARANGIVNPNILFVGQTLIIPTGGTTQPAPGSDLPTPVATAMGLVTEAATAAATSEAAATTAATVAPTETTIPTATTAATADATVQITITTPTAGAPQVAAVPATYVVQAGDNLYRISLKFNTTMPALMQLNGLANQNVIYVGQVLKIPGGTGPASTGAAATAVGTESAPTNMASNVGFSSGIIVALGSQDANLSITSVQDLGTGWVKVPVLWNTLETSKGQIDFTKLDALVNGLSGAGLKVLLTVSSAPDWARSTTSESGPPDDLNDFANFMGALASHYQGKVQAYEVWSEPNIRREWSGRPLSAASYVELLRLGYTALKKVDPALIVVSAGPAPTGFNDGVNAIDDRVFMRQAYQAGLASYSDAIGAHPNGWANPPDSTCCNASPGVSGWFNDRSFYFRDTLKDYRDIMTQNGDSGTFIWPTEFGWGASEGVTTDPNSVDTNYGFVKFVTQAQQALYVPRAYELGRTLGYIGPMFLSNLNACQVYANDPNNPASRECYFSALDAQGQPRPVYNAVKTMRK